MQQAGAIQFASMPITRRRVHVFHMILLRTRCYLGQMRHQARQAVDILHRKIHIASRAAASRCSTVLVEPPIAISRFIRVFQMP